MRVLGISDGMTGGAALIADGKVLYAIHEERLIRAKMATGFPRASVAKVLEDTHTRPADIDAIAIATVNEFFREQAVAYEGWFPPQQASSKEVLLNVASVVSRVFGGKALLRQSYYEVKAFAGRARRKAIERVLRHEWGFACPIKFIDHHFAHACSAYFTSGLADATVITLDGAGDNSSSRVYMVKDGRFRKIWNVDSFNSLGNYYAYITHICGFKAHKHEGKITGLAAYGTPVYADLLRGFIAYEDGQTINKGQVFHRAAVKAIAKALPASYRREDLASSIQQVLEEVGSAYIQHWVEKTGCGDLALAGGVFANVKFNQRIHALKNVHSIFIHPGMGDEGLAVGAALALGARAGLDASRQAHAARLVDVYFGPSYSEREIASAIAQAGLQADYVPDIERRVAELLAQGYVVCRFDGRMEYGPRALGNRSILYQATDPTVNDWLNKRLKRTEFMPFAPVTLAEFADQCYENLDGARYPAKFMTITFDCTDWMKKHCPAVVHVDGTARPQIIDRQTNPSYYRIVDEYRKITGLPSVINTSFNMHEEPIVCSPSEALRAFTAGQLDYLALGHHLLSHPDRQTRELAGHARLRQRIGADQR